MHRSPNLIRSPYQYNICGIHILTILLQLKYSCVVGEIHCLAYIFGKLIHLYEVIAFTQVNGISVILWDL